ncbi:MAG TPA: GNAT family N-acetyltransferase, partial [Dermatophilaceae bacterium]|nr:GNAT family N-acetyltransferase [Dermatophilaceae bacterium]
MVSDAAYRIVPLSPATWPAFEALVQRHNGIFGGCWCTWFHDGHPSCVGRGETFEGNRAIKKRLVDEGVARAALVMDGDEAIAWAEFGTPAQLPTIHH